LRPFLLFGGSRFHYYVFALDLLHILASCAIDLGDLHNLIAGDRTVRTRICADDKSAPLKSPTSILLNDSLEEIEKERRLLKTAVPILGKRGMMRNLLIEA